MAVMTQSLEGSLGLCIDETPIFDSDRDTLAFFGLSPSALAARGSLLQQKDVSINGQDKSDAVCFRTTASPTFLLSDIMDSDYWPNEFQDAQTVPAPHVNVPETRAPSYVPAPPEGYVFVAVPVSKFAGPAVAPEQQQPSRGARWVRQNFSVEVESDANSPNNGSPRVDTPGSQSDCCSPRLAGKRKQSDGPNFDAFVRSPKNRHANHIPSLHQKNAADTLVPSWLRQPPKLPLAGFDGKLVSGALGLGCAEGRDAPLSLDPLPAPFEIPSPRPAPRPAPIKREPAPYPPIAPKQPIYKGALPFELDELVLRKLAEEQRVKLQQEIANEHARTGGSRSAPPMPPSGAKVSREELIANFEHPIEDVARRLGVCVTVLKKICRSHGINRWPQRKLRSVARWAEQADIVVKHRVPGFEHEAVARMAAQLRETRSLLYRDPSASIKHVTGAIRKLLVGPIQQRLAEMQRAAAFAREEEDEEEGEGRSAGVQMDDIATYLQSYLTAAADRASAVDISEPDPRAGDGQPLLVDAFFLR